MLKPTVKKLAALTLCALLALPLAACQENPEGSIVAHKDMEKRRSAAAATDPEKVGAAAWPRRSRWEKTASGALPLEK